MHTGRARTKVGLSDPVVPHGRAIAQWIKGSGDLPQELHIDGGLALSMSAHHILGCSRSQGSAVRPLKWYAESERRETVRSLSVAGVGNSRRPILSTRGPG